MKPSGRDPRRDQGDEILLGSEAQLQILARLLQRQAESHLADGELDLAAVSLARARSCSETAGDLRVAMTNLRLLVAVAALRGRWSVAEECSAELVQLAKASGSRLALAVALRVRAELLSDAAYAVETGDSEAMAEALAAFDAAVAVLHGVDDRVERGRVLRAHASCLIALGETRRALELVQRAKRLLAH